jgi:hypothetical protein
MTYTIPKDQPMNTYLPRSAFLIATVCGCSSVEPTPPTNDEEVITTIALRFTPAGGGAPVVSSHADPENDGAPIIDTVTLASGTTYSMAVEFRNELAEPAEDITQEVAAESDEHLVLVYGDGVEGPATGTNAAKLVTHSYDDTDENGFPIGLSNTVVAVVAGSANLQIMLRHMPAEDDIAVKIANVAESFATAGSTGIGGDVDVDVTFPITVE